MCSFEDSVVCEIEFPEYEKGVHAVIQMQHRINRNKKTALFTANSSFLLYRLRAETGWKFRMLKKYFGIVAHLINFAEGVSISDICYMKSIFAIPHVNRV